MSRRELLQIASAAHLLDAAEAWNELWRRSATTMPLLRAEPLAEWIKQFGGSRRFVALVVVNEGHFEAALPLVERRRGLGRYGAMPTNEWAHAGDLLLAPERTSAPLDLLVQALPRLPWPKICLAAVELETERWTSFIQGLRRREISARCETLFHVGLISTTGTWRQYLGCLSKNHRRRLARRWRQAQSLGRLELETHVGQFSPEIVDRVAREAFDLEDRGWKHETGTSVLQTKGMLEYYLRNAHLLSNAGCLAVSFLRIDEYPIAFEFGWVAKGVYHAYKIGYDPGFRHLSPGQLLVYALLERFHGDETIRIVNTMGPLDHAVRSWRPQPFPIGKVTIHVKNRAIGRWLAGPAAIGRAVGAD